MKRTDKSKTLSLSSVQCGMHNAYTVSFLNGRRAGWRGSNARNDDNGAPSERRESKQIAPVVVAHRLKTGEERRRIEMVEHAKRQEVLRHFHLPEAVSLFLISPRLSCNGLCVLCIFHYEAWG